MKFGMTARTLFIALAFAFAGGLACAQDAPIARSHADAAPPAVQAAPVSTGATTPQSTTQLAAAVQTPAPTPTPSSSDPTGQQIADWLRADSSPVQPLDPRAQPFADPDAPRQIHGEVEIGVSNRGYGGHVAASMPLGEASELDVAVAAAHVHTRWGDADPRSLSVGLYLDGGDVSRFLSRDKCHVPRYGVSLPTDPQLQADGSCIRTDKTEVHPGD